MTEQLNNNPQASRSTVLTQNGIVCSASPLAATTGIQVLSQGGNAFDAAIAVAAVETVCLTPLCGIGGEVFALLWNAKEQKLYGLTGSGKSPRLATPEFFYSQGYQQIPVHGPLASSIPGEVDAWDTIHRKFGTRDFKSLLEPAINYAKEGFPLPNRVASFFAAQTPKLNRFPTSKLNLTHDGEPYLQGQVLRQSQLGNTLERIALYGRDEFYEGETTRELVKAVQEAGGIFSEQDFKEHSSVLYEDPLCVTYRGHQVFTTSPPSQGIIVLEMLNILEGFPIANSGWGSSESIHWMVEAKKIAYGDRLAHLGDPNFINFPVKNLLSKDYGEKRRKEIGLDSVIKESDPTQFESIQKDSTSYFCVADRFGNLVSFIHSISNHMGSGFIAGNTGILLNNRVGRGFYLQEGANQLAPQKRTMNTIQSYMVLKDGKPWIVGGTPGGDAQSQWNVQVLTGMIDFHLNPQQAADAPRWTSYPGTDPSSIDDAQVVTLEPGFPDTTYKNLQDRGHVIEHIELGQSLGGVQLIQINHETQVFEGGCDYRTDGQVAAH